MAVDKLSINRKGVQYRLECGFFIVNFNILEEERKKKRKRFDLLKLSIITFFKILKIVKIN